MVGGEFPLEILKCSTWTSGLTLVSERFQAGNVFLGGDTVHLFTPTGGLGYNTAVDDAVNLGWKLAGLVKGWGGEGLVASYELERQPIAQRNTSFARGFAQSIGGFDVPVEWRRRTQAVVVRLEPRWVSISAHMPARNSISPGSH